MTSIRKNHTPPVSVYRDPAPADYYDEVQECHRKALKDAIKKEFEGEKVEVVDGPAW